VTTSAPEDDVHNPPIEETSWLLDADGDVVYSVRRSRRAKRILLSITPSDGLIVTIPERVALRHVPEIIAERREWIHDVSTKLAHDRARHLDHMRTPLLPETIDLRSLGERRWVRYEACDATRVTVREEGPYRLVVTGQDFEAAMQAALRKWLVGRARSALVPWLQELAVHRSLTVTHTSIRNQRTRWASCSAEGRISLNYNLLFLPRRLVRLVLVHELCHLTEMNHSRRFWRLLENEEPDLIALKQELGRAWELVPRWSHG